MAEKKALRKEAREIAKAILASPDFQRLAEQRAEHRRLDEIVAKARRANPDRAYAYDLAKATGDKSAQEYVERTADPGRAARRERAERLRKSSSGESRQLGEAEIDRLDAEDRAELERQQALRREGWSRP